MKKTIWAIVLIIILLIAVSILTHVGKKVSVTNDSTSTTTSTGKMGLTPEPVFTFKYKVNPRSQHDIETGGTTGTLQVYSGSKLFQTLTVDAVDLPSVSMDDAVEHVDVNFDGYKDLAILSCQGATGNQCFSFYLWNPTIGKFEFSQEFTDADSLPSPDYPNQLHSFWSMGCAGACYDEQFYKVVNNKPVLVKEVTQTLNSDATKATKVTKELKNGSYVTATTTEPFTNI